MPATDSAARLLAPPPARCEGVLSSAAIAFLSALARRFEATRQALLERRRQRQQELDAGRLPAFLAATRDIREREWTVAPIPPHLRDRRGEITGPVHRKMATTALTQGASAALP